MPSDHPMHIDLKAIFRSRGGAAAKVPSWCVGMLEKIIHQSELNAILDHAWPRQGAPFCESVLEYLDIGMQTCGLENIPSGQRLIFAGNHPLGGLDGISIISVLGRMYGDDNFRFLVNDMLMNVEPLRSVFLPINKYGSQGREAARLINECYASDKQMAIFPAGLVSRKGHGGIADLTWQKAFVAKAAEYGRLIVPMYFDGLNRPSFYNLAQWRKRLGIKVNLEQAMLPAEVCAARGKRFRLIFGKPINPENLATSGRSLLSQAAEVKKKVYELRSEIARQRTDNK